MKHKDLTSTIDDILENCQPFLSIINNNPKFIPLRDMGGLSLSYDDDAIQHFKTRTDRHGQVNRGLTKLILENTFEEKDIPSRYKNVIITSSLGKNSLFGFDEDQACYIIPKGKFTYAYLLNDFNSGPFNKIGNIYVSLYNILDADGLSDTLNEFETEFSIATVEQIESISKKYIDKALQHIGDDIRGRESIKKAHQNILKILNDIQYYYFGSNGIKTDNFTEAFSKENEIWFNCESYYAIPYTNTKLVGEFFERIKNP